MRRIVLYLLFTGATVFSGCTMNYSFSGASIPPQLETVSVQYFDNRAPVIYPSLSQELTDDLKDVFQSRTRLRLVNDIGDADFEGFIEQYRTQPVSVQADEQANLERLTISVRVSYTNTADPEQDFETSFSRHEDYDARAGLEAVEAQLVEKIIDQLTEDIFNRAFVNW
ncbi:MAG: LptE family protein [Bacteroidales bacterium]